MIENIKWLIQKFIFDLAGNDEDMTNKLAKKFQVSNKQ
jgi:hypothetical protein